MILKYKLLSRLQDFGGFISKETLSKEFGLTAGEVNALIEELIADGNQIEINNAIEYRLIDELSVSPSRVKAQLNKELEVVSLATVDSTFRITKELAAVGAPETVVIAAAQTAGRGRLGRSFSSPGKSGLYMSVLLYPDCEAADATLITTAAAVAVSRAVDSISPGSNPKIKWVNDVYLNDRKICGILTEGRIDPETQKLAYAMLGIGINIYPPEQGWDEEIRDRAGAIFDRNSGEDYRAKLCSLILNELYKLYPALNSDEFFGEYEARMFLVGREVTVLPSGKTAVVLGLDGDFRLKVRYEDLSEALLSTGEVSLKI